MQPPEIPAVDVLIPAWNEEGSLPLVLAAIPRPTVRRVVVADNNSRDGTARVAREGGAVVVPAPVQGYGSACLAGLDHLRQKDPPDVVAVASRCVPGGPLRAGHEPRSSCQPM